MEKLIKKNVYQIAKYGYHFRVEIKSNFTFTFNLSTLLKCVCNL